MTKIRYTVILFFVAFIKLFAKIDSIYDSSKIIPKTLPQRPSDIYTGKDFIYEETAKEPSFFARVLLWIYIKIIEFLNKLFDFDIKTDNLSGLNALWTALIILLIVLIIIGLFFFFKKFQKTLGRSDKNYLSAEEAEKFLHEVNFDKMIDAALKDKNYRLTIRFYYLKMLKLMADKKLIVYEYQKTNYEYYYEITNPELKNLFKEISFVFDYWWYGEHIASEQDFLIAQKKFNEFQNLIDQIITK